MRNCVGVDGGQHFLPQMFKVNSAKTRDLHIYQIQIERGRNVANVVSHTFLRLLSFSQAILIIYLTFWQRNIFEIQNLFKQWLLLNSPLSLVVKPSLQLFLACCVFGRQMRSGAEMGKCHVWTTRTTQLSTFGRRRRRLLTFGQCQSSVSQLFPVKSYGETHPGHDSQSLRESRY